MLSAIASRKAQARQAEKAINFTTVPFINPARHDTTPSYLNSSDTFPSPAQKRKRGPLQHLGSPKQSTKDSTELNQSVVDRDYMERSASSLSGASDSQTLKRKRAYSPSQVLLSSDGEDMMQRDDEHTEDVSLVKSAHLSPQTQIDSAVSTFQPKINFNIFPNTLCGTVILLRPQETLCFVGVVLLTVLKGRIEIYGTDLDPSRSPHTVYAPRCHPLPIIKVSTVPPTLPTNSRLPTSLEERFTQGDAAVLLQPCYSGIECIGKICRVFSGVFEAPNKGLSRPIAVEGFYPIYDSDSNVSPFHLPTSWRSGLESVAPSGRSLQSLPRQTTIAVIVKGSKRSGKSTFARTLTNRLLSRYQRVAYLECDIGQSEFTPGGMVSLNIISRPVLGPPFTHPLQPYRAHFIGSSSPKSTPSSYINAISDLVNTYRMDIQYGALNADMVVAETSTPDERINHMVPMVVNTQGWAKGMGADLLRAIEAVVEPTHTFSFEREDIQWQRRSDGHDNEVDTGLGTSGDTKWTSDLNLNLVSTLGPLSKYPTGYYLQPISQSPLTSLFTSSDHRHLLLLSYLYSRCTLDCDGDARTTWITSIPIVAQPPYEVEWKSAIDSVILVGSGAGEVVRDEVHNSLRGSLVALVAADEGRSYETSDWENEESGGITSAANTIPFVQGSAAPDPSITSCVGIGIIRAISPTSPTFHILTPIPPSLLRHCRILVQGELELPIWGFLEEIREPRLPMQKNLEKGQQVCGVSWDEVPYLHFGRSSATGGAVRKGRRNIMRRDQA